jgi:hypothetical protein
VSTGELPAVETLVAKALADPVGLAERLLGELAQRLASGSSAAPVVVPGYPSQAYETLTDRNVLLAAALGACECWGEDPECRDCAGSGAPGWIPPDPELFAEYVGPALRRVRPDAPSERATVHEKEEQS